jgi:hypothetical protein
VIAAEDPFAHALAYAVETVWNDEAGYQRFHRMRCARAGRMFGSAVFVCHATFTMRNGETRSYRGVILADGTPV